MTTQNLLIFLKYIISQVNGKGTLNLLDVGGKARSKADVYQPFSSEGRLYLPPEKCYTNFIAGIIEGKLMLFSIFKLLL